MDRLGTIFSSGAPGCSGVRAAQSLVFCIVLCRPLLVIIFIFTLVLTVSRCIATDCPFVNCSYKYGPSRARFIFLNNIDILFLPLNSDIIMVYYYIGFRRNKNYKGRHWKVMRFYSFLKQLIVLPEFPHFGGRGVLLWPSFDSFYSSLLSVCFTSFIMYIYH